MKIVDAHHHFWDPETNYHPWLRDVPMIPFRYGDYSSIRKRFMPADYDRVAKKQDVIASVTMEGEWDPKDPLGEARWIQQLVATETRPAAHAAQAWLDRDDLPEVLEQLAELPVVRSIRHKPNATAAPGGQTGGLSELAFARGYKQLATYGFHFELQTPWWHLVELIPLIDCSPDTKVIINHTGLPSDRTADGLAGWLKALRTVAEFPQVFIKISGLGLAGKNWLIEDNNQIINRTIEVFGPDRCMLASNFPVDGLCGSFDTIWSGFEQATKHLTNSERSALFCKTAIDLYRLDSHI